MFKRNQVEEAIAAVMEPGSRTLSSGMRTRLKRLREVDRDRGRSKRSADPEAANFAFYSSDAPGKGGEDLQTSYEVFALMMAVRMMGHGWPQGYVVSMLRRLRGDLEPEHARILRQDPTRLFDTQEIRKSARPGALAADSTDPVFLVVASKERADSGEAMQSTVCRGQEALSAFIRHQPAGHAWTIFEIVSTVHQLGLALAGTTPQKRGRAG
jgi:hypothetical protein